jgi:hypothetical protein
VARDRRIRLRTVARVREVEEGVDHGGVWREDGKDIGV